jgi:hypothetical protein
MSTYEYNQTEETPGGQKTGEFSYLEITVQAEGNTEDYGYKGRVTVEIGGDGQQATAIEIPEADAYALLAALAKDLGVTVG